MEKIDFVVTWVDGNDLAWRVEKQKWETLEKGVISMSGEANAACRYRSDTEMLRYWFRAVEKFAPWVNIIHFVTCGQKPCWLNEKHPKLNMVNHKEYIPSQYLPTYNASCINLNLHRIDCLAEHFVVFDDDVLLLQPVVPEFFFKKGNPVLIADLRYEYRVGYNNWSRTLLNDQCVVNECFDMKKQIWDNRWKWFNVKALGLKRVRQNFFCYLANKYLPVRLFGHLSSPQLKSTICEVWEKRPEVMDNTCRNKFRGDDRVNIWLLSAWNQAKGCFYPIHENGRGKNFSISTSNIDRVCDAIRSQMFPQICINDTAKNDNPDYCNSELIKAFDSILPEQSQFEKF